MQNHKYKTALLLIIAVAMTASVYGVATTDLLSYYSFDNTSGATLYDQLGNTDGTLSGATISAAQHMDGANSLYLDGVNDWVEMATAWPVSNDFSVCGWWRRGNSGGYGAIFMSGRSGTGYNYYLRHQADEAGYFYVDDDTVTARTKETTYFTENVWKHFCATFNDTGNEIKLYIDGDMEHSNSTTWDYTTPTYNAASFLGCFRITDCTNADIVGYMDEISVWNKTLSSFEIAQLYYGGTGTYYPFIEYTTFTANTMLGVPITNFSVTITNGTTTLHNTTTTGSLVMYVPAGYTFTYNASATHYNQTYGSLTTGLIESITLYEINTFLVTLNDEITNELIDDRTSHLEIISDSYAQNYTTTTGYINVTAIVPDTYVLRYWAENYTTHFYRATLSNDVIILTLYLLNDTSSDELNLIVVDDIGNKIPNAVVKTQRYDLSTNSYKTVDIQVANDLGRLTVNVQPDAEFYRFVVEIDGVVVLTTNPEYMYSSYMDETTDVYTLQVFSQQETLQDFYTLAGVSYLLSFNETSYNFRFNYNDPTNTAAQTCVRVYRVYHGTEIYVNQSCSASASGLILVPAYGANNTVWKATASMTFNSIESVIASLTHVFPKTVDFGDAGLWILLLLTLVAATLFAYNPVLALIVTPLPTLVLSLIGIVPIRAEIAIFVTVMFVMVAMIFNKVA